MESRLRQFSCPSQHFDEHFLEILAVEHARHTVELFLTRLRQRRVALDPGIIRVLEDWMCCDGEFETAWDVSFGDLFLALQSSNEPKSDVLVPLAIHLCQRGIEGYWQAKLQSPRRFRWECWLLPAAKEILVDSRQGSARVYLTSSDKRYDFEFTHINGFWQANVPDKLPQFGGLGRKITFVGLEAAHSGEFDEREVVPLILENVGHSEVAHCDAALEIIGRHAETYLPWVLRVLRHVIPLRPEGELNHSGTFSHKFGLIHMSLCASELALGEMLVHESTHQYFHLAERLGTVHDGSDGTLYYSPVKGTGRPLDRILLAYHAFGNVLLYYQSCLAANSPEPKRCERNIQVLSDIVATLETPLRENPALTAVGRALRDPLMERVHCVTP